MKTPVLILHGWAYDVEKWHPFLHELQGYGIRTKLLHVPGLTTEPLQEAWTIDDYVEWLDKQIGTTRAILLGHSNGGRIALNYAQRFPNKVERLILIDSAGVRPSGLKVTTKRTAFKGLAKVGKVFTKSPKARRLLYRLARERDYYNADMVMRQTMSNLLESDKALDLTQVKVPALLIWGRDDGATPLKLGRTMQQRLTGSKLEIIDGARHSPQFTHAQTVADLIKRELDDANL